MANEKDPFGTPDADGWYEWEGDDMIRPAGRVEIVLRSGDIGASVAQCLQWGHEGTGYDIVKWRPAQ